MTGLVGRSLGRYHILEQLGAGGMATVYKAHDERLEATVAIKVIRMERLPREFEAQVLGRFKREAKALANLTHPNIVKVIDFGEYEGWPYLVMTYLAGGTLRQRLRGKPIDWREAVRFLTPIARALQYAHQHGVLHRDVKPSNILTTESGEPMLADFGVAKMLTDAEQTSDLTGTGMTVGTAAYMAPEQAAGKPVDHRADIYSLGVVLYEMMTGRKPYKADTPVELAIKQATEPLSPPSLFAPGLPDSVERLLLRALAKDRVDRFPDMAAMVRAMQSLRDDGPARAASMPGPSAETAAEPSKSATREDAVRPGGAQWWKIAAGVGATALVVGAGILAVPRLMNPGATSAPSASVASPTSDAAVLIGSTLPVSSPTPAATATPEFTIGSEMTRETDGMVMVYVPAGEFTMGTNSGEPDEGPPHQVYLDAYWIDKTEVSNSMYAKCVASGPCQTPGSSVRLSLPDQPLTLAPWSDAKAYCEWVGGQLPTEAQWEKAARGTQAWLYPWGNEMDTNRLFMGASTEAKPVNSYPSGASPYGALNMAGNAFEYVADWYSATYYSSPAASTPNPTGPESETEHVFRGGYSRTRWVSGKLVSFADFRVTTRTAENDRYYGTWAIGFRCAMGGGAPVADAVGQSPEATPGIGTVRKRNTDGMLTVYVPAGNFVMGSTDADPKADFDEKPQHTVYLEQFWIDQTEVTNAMRAACVEAGECLPPADIGPYDLPGYFTDPQYADFPTVNASWADAKAYCEWAGARLPSEAEWEKASRGVGGQTFPWGAGADCSRANYGPLCRSAQGTVAVRTYGAGKSPYDAYEMAGNVYEWVADWYAADYYSSSPQTNPLGPQSGMYRVYRGGGWNFDSSLLRSANRDFDAPETRNLVIGFRCAMNAVN